MKKTIKVIILLLVAIVSVKCIQSFIEYEFCVYNRIIKNNSYVTVDETRLIDLRDYTWFEWDRVVIYNWPVGLYTIADYTGLDLSWHDGIDLVSGWMFVKEGKVVHEETFDNAFIPDKVCRFYAYTHSYEGKRKEVIDKEDSIFELRAEKVRDKNGNPIKVYRIYNLDD